MEFVKVRQGDRIVRLEGCKQRLRLPLEMLKVGFVGQMSDGHGLCLLEMRKRLHDVAVSGKQGI
jgi:hypothetical protein